MKVLHFSALDGQTGAGVAAARIHTGLLARGVTSRFCVAYPSTGLEQAFIPSLSLVGRLTRALQARAENRQLAPHLCNYDYVLSTGRIGFDIARIVEAERPDIVQLHWINGNSFRLASLASVKTPIVWRMSDMWPFCGLQHLQPDEKAYVTPVATSASDLSEQVRQAKQATYRKLRRLTLVSPSRWLEAETRRSALLGERPIQRIPTSCDTTLFSSRDRSACRQVLGLAAEARIVLVGATSMGTQWKGLDLFVEAMAQLAATNGRDIEIVTFGKDPFVAPALDGLVGLRHMGVVRDPRLMAALYSAADVYVAPSRMENLSNAVLESLACGTPVVAFDIGGMPDMIDHQVNGWLAAPFDTAQLAQGIGWALDHRSDVTVRTAARLKILDGFSLDQEIDGYLALYQSLLGGG